MITGIKLDIFTELSKGSKNATELAESLNLNKSKLSPLLYMLVKAELLTVDNGIFSNTEDANTYLVKDKPQYTGGFISMMLESTQKTAETIKTGKPQSKFDFEKLPEATLFKIFQGLHAGSLKVGVESADKLNLSAHKHLLDVAGGSGGLVIGSCENYPHIEATIVELPTIVPITKKGVFQKTPFFPYTFY